MVKVFTEQERKEMGEVTSFELMNKYPNKAFIMINSRDFTETVNGLECNSGSIGILYAMADIAGYEDYLDLVADIVGTSEFGEIATFNSLHIKDGLNYAEV